MANKKFSEFELKTTTSNVSHIVGYNGAENVRITPANFLDTTGGPYLPLAGGTMTGNTIHNDNVRSIYGTSSDGLQILHNGTDSLILDSGTGNLRILGSTSVRIQNQGDNADMIVGNSAASVDLYYNNSKKFETTSFGALVTGDLGINTTPTVQLEVKGSTFSLIRINGANNFDAGIDFGDTDDIDIGRIRYTNIDDSMQFWTNGSERMRLDSSGNLGLGTSSPEAKMHIQDGSAGTVTASSEADLVVESSLDTAINLLSPDNKQSSLYFGSPSDNIGCQVAWSHSVKDLIIGTAVTSGGEIAFKTGNNSEKMRIDSAGNCGIGTASPSNTLTLGSNDSVHTDLEVRFSSVPIYVSGGYNGTATTNQLSSNFKDTSTSSGGDTVTNLDNESFGGLAYRQSSINSPTGSFHSWSYAAPTAGTPSVVELMRLNASGNLGIGVTPSSKLDVLVGNDERLLFTNVNAKPIISAVNAANGSYKTLQLQGSDLYFMISGTEKMRLTSTGDLLVGTTGVPDGTSHYGSGFIPVSSDKVQLRMASNSTAAGTLVAFYNPNGTVGDITISGSATAYNTSSDYRLKEDLQDFKGLDLVSKIPVYDYKWKADKSRSYGVMAHELQEVLPQAVSGEKDAEEMQSVDYSKIVPLLVKSIQELSAKLEALECQCEKK